MLKSLRSRFIFTHILPTLLVAPLAGLIVLYLIETEVLLDDLATDVSGQALLLASFLEADDAIWDDSAEAQFFISRVATAVSGTIVLLDADGNVLAAQDDNLTDSITLPDAQSDTQVRYTLLQQTAESIVPVYDVEEQLAGYVRVSSTLEEASALFTTLRQLILVSVLAEIILAAVIGAYLATRMARPVNATTTAVAEIALGQRIEPIREEGPQEIRVLAHSVNSLSAQLRELEETRRKLLANLVHELGRPLGAMSAAVNVLRDGADEDPELRRELLKGIEEHIHQMQPLLDDLAQLHGQVLGNRELNRRPLSLSDWLPPLLLPWRAAALAKGLRWEAAVDEHLPILDLDADRMAQVIGNLLSNAIKHSPSGELVTINALSQADSVVITVTNTGPGIAVSEQERVFEPFYRSRGQTRFPQGMGLGLTIARDLVRAHGGTLTLESEPGQSTTFTLTLPPATSVNGSS